MKLYKALARCAHTINTSDHAETVAHYREKLKIYTSLYLPSGSGVDNGCEVNLDRSYSNKLVINVPFHHMDDAGQYRNWTTYKAIVVPNLLLDFDVIVSGREPYYGSGTKDEIAQQISQAVDTDVPTELAVLRAAM